MTNYIPIDSVLTRIPKSIRDNYNDLEILRFALEAYRDLELTQAYEHDVRTYSIENHTVQLDSDIRLINNVYLMHGDPCDEDLKSLCDITTESDNVCNNSNDCYCCKESVGYDSRTEDTCRHTINYQLFLDSPYFKNNYTPLKYIGNSVGITKNCSWKFNAEPLDTYSVDKNKLLRTGSIACANICIDFEREVLSDDGKFMIPDIEKLKRGLAMYATAMFMLDDFVSHTAGSGQTYSTLLQQAEILLKSAKSKIMSRSINPHTVANILYSDQKLLRNKNNFRNDQY